MSRPRPRSYPHLVEDLALGLLLVAAVGLFLYVWVTVVARAHAAPPPLALWPSPTLRLGVEHTGPGYDRTAFSYPPVVEGRAARLYNLRSMYTNHRFASIEESQIEHLVPLKNVWAAGAWQWPDVRKRAFARDALNITLAQPTVNRAKSAHTPDEWLPPKNQCFYAVQWVAVKLKWGLSVTPAEWAALLAVIQRCAVDSTAHSK